jgi:hypothetical protein
MAATAVPTQRSVARIPTSYQSAVAITPADDTAIGPFIGLYVGVAGDVTVVMRNESASTPRLFKAVPAGTILPISIQGVQATGTTATNLTGLG